MKIVTPNPNPSATEKVSAFRNYLSLGLMFAPGILFGVFLFLFRKHPNLQFSAAFPFVPWQFYVIAIAGAVGTWGGTRDWQFHRDPLNLRLPAKERDAEALALGAGGIPMFVLMCLATLAANPEYYLVPIVLVLIYTVVAICYDEFVFHRKRCGKQETRYHRALVFGNGVAWLAWFSFVYVQV